MTLIAVQHRVVTKVDTKEVPPDPVGDRFKRHHLPQDGLVGKP
jgi:hypothetical protein